MRSESKIGFIARCDQGGLGILSREYAAHLPFEKIMVVTIGSAPQYPEAFQRAQLVSGVPTDADIREFLKGLDVLFCIETPYNMRTFEIAREMRVKTVLLIMWEWHNLQLKPDLLLAPVDWHQPAGAIVADVPIDTQVHQFRQRKWADTFVHVAGHKATMDRNGTDTLVAAMRYVTTPAKLIVWSQMKLNYPADRRIEFRIGDFGDNRYLYREGDVFIMPRHYAGLCLPVNEAMAAGMPILMSDMAPQNKVLPKEWLIPVDRLLKVQIKQTVDYAEIDPRKVAQKIDEWYHKDIWQHSKLSRKMALERSWKTLRPALLKLLQA